MINICTQENPIEWTHKRQQRTSWTAPVNKTKDRNFNSGSEALERIRSDLEYHNSEITDAIN